MWIRKSEQLPHSACEEEERPGLEPLVAAERRRRVEAGAETCVGPEDGCEHDLDAVVDRILQQEQIRAYGWELPPQSEQVIGCRAGDGERQAEQSDGGDAEHRRDGDCAPLPPRRRRFRAI